ncbi:restriction endonuclease subunit S [Vibrio cholerae]|uniref:Type I restriction modification DNA specificity domain-containing protein n=1 Tax=Vibrio zhanjiangensis TaxID=1046128 RepID=A0ABQ6ESV4_9VIBR|nr:MULTISPECIES: restriction endonuclease subunit S [Vibrio]EGR1090893.1 restriction endonuclease subunit S [Vibrio cholerae]KFE21801.1 type I restriction modification DNA specificity domain protein [Vibrio cholerae]TXZ37724.1 restriction endonuclease subunit S [Vibrio cholerae]BCK26922.1 hypothetical protein VCSRO77_0236 [Vibrio cholerae]BCK29662.1 hypothetical protein VCSRO77_3077 [Vibrio cholerae]
MVPKGWLKTNFGAVTEIANGQVDPKVEPYLSMLHIGPENVVSDSGQIIGVVTCKESNLISGKYEFDENAIVYSKIRPNLNKVCRPRFKGVCSADMYPIWAKGELDIEFLLHFMLGPQFYKVAVAMSMRTGMPKINRSDLNTVTLLLPPVEEQKKIAQILSAWDKAITTTEQLLANSQQQKKALMQQLLTGKKRLLDKHGVRFSGEWKWLRASELFKPVSKKNNSDSEELLAVTQDQGVLPRSLLERRVVMPDGSTNGYKLVVPGNFIISLRSFQGGLEYSGYRGLVSPAYTVLEPIKSIDDEFYKHYYKSYDFIGHLAVAVIGIRDGKQISYSDFSFLKLPYPSLEEQQKIAAVLSTADQEISALQQKLDALKQEKKALMQQLLTGKRRVVIE